MRILEANLKAPNGTEYAQPIGLWIDNEWRSSKKGEMITSVNPSDESEIISVHAAGAEDVDDAVDAARRAFKSSSWRDVPPAGRGDLMFNLASLVEQHAQTLATIETWDNGKPYSAAIAEDIPEVVGALKYYAGWADKLHGQTIDVVRPGLRIPL